MGLVLVLVGVLAYGSYVAHGGFYVDDWSDLAGYHFAHAPRYWSDVSELHAVLGGRPLLALLLPVPNALFGVRPEPYLALALGLGIVTSWCFYLLLRTLSMAPLHAAAIAVLALLFPWSDATRLWSTASVTTLSVCFFCLGLVVALHGLKRRGRAAIAMHTGADVLYLLSVLTYEATGAAALLAGLLYLGRAPAASVARRWLADAVVVLGALSYSLSMTVTARHVGSLSERIGDIAQFTRQSALLLVSAIVPRGSSSTPIQALVLFAVTVIVGFGVARLRRGADGALREWLWWVAVAGVAVGAAYFMFLGSHLHPLDPGIDTRTNVFAGLAYSVLAYAIIATASHLVFRSSQVAATTTLSAAVLIAVGYGVRVRDDEAAWRQASALQYQVLTAIDRDLPPLPRASTLLTFDHPAQAAPEVPVFYKSYDLRGALELHANDPTLRAYPVSEGIAVRCEPGSLTVAGPQNYGTYRIGYGRVFFLDVAAGEGRRISSSVACTEALSRFQPKRGF